MPPEQTTTFIPRQPVASQAAGSQKTGDSKLRPARKYSSKPIGLLTFLAGLTLTVVLVLVGVLFGYQYLLQRQTAGLEVSLSRVEEPLRPAFLEEIDQLHNRIAQASDLLNKHVAISPVFELFEKLTLQKIRYAEFGYSHSGQSSTGVILLSGEAEDYTAIANQSSIFNATPFITSHIFSEFTLQETGRIRFTLQVLVKPDLYLFSNTLGELPLTRR